MIMSKRDILIWLNSIGVKNSTIDKLLIYLGDIRDIWDMDRSHIYDIPNINIKTKEKISNNRNINKVKRLYERLYSENIKVVSIYDKSYPEKLKQIYDSPKVLYIKGNLKIEDEISIAIVGSRKSTSYGQWACEKFTKELVDLGVTIVSGLALGIDTIAHKTAIRQKGRTIGVLGNGIDIIYPKKNLSLYKEVEENGAIISEFPIGTQPMNYNFPQRNRIISGLSLGLIVIEAQDKSGSLITATHALEQGKDIFAVPGNINSIFSIGTNKLIKDGAIPLLNIDDIIEEIELIKKGIKKGIKRKNEKEKDYSNYSKTEIEIIKILEEEPAHSDIIAYRLKQDISTINSILIILELKGVVKRMTGNIFTIF